MTAAGTQHDRLLIETDVEAKELRERLGDFSPWPSAIEFSNGVSTSEFERAEPFDDDPLATFRMFAEQLPPGLEGGKALDIGCQLGHNTFHLTQQYGAVVTGIDPSRRNIEIARYLAQVSRTGAARFQLGDPNQFLSDERFDLILHLHTLEYLRDPFLALRNAVHMLNPGGCLVLEHATYRDPEGDDTLCRFHRHIGPRDRSKPWWSLGAAAVINMLQAAGCARCDIVHVSPEENHIYRRLLIAYRSAPEPSASAPSHRPAPKLRCDTRQSRRERVFLVAGSHRAGTSVITRLLQHLGLYLGEEAELLGPIENDNEAGFYEHEAIMRVSDQLLTRLGGTWREPPVLAGGWELDPALNDLRERARQLITETFAGRPLWGFKDPRLSLTLPFWRTVISPTGSVIAHRCPLDVARSLQRRNGIALGHGVALSSYYTACAIVGTRAQPRVFVGYEELFTAPEEVLGTLTASLEVADPPPWASIAEAVDPRLRHHASAGHELDAQPALTGEARELFERLKDPGASDDLDALAARIVQAGPPREASPSGRAAAGRPLARAGWPWWRCFRCSTSSGSWRSASSTCASRGLAST